MRHEQLQKSSDGSAFFFLKDEYGNKSQEKETASHALCPGCLLMGKGWQVTPNSSMEDRSIILFYIFLSAMPLLRQKCHEIFSDMIIDLTFSSGLASIPLHGPVKAANFEDCLQKLHSETILARK